MKRLALVALVICVVFCIPVFAQSDEPLVDVQADNDSIRAGIDLAGVAAETEGATVWQRIKNAPRAVCSHIGRNKGKYIGGVVAGVGGYVIKRTIDHSSGTPIVTSQDKPVTDNSTHVTVSSGDNSPVIVRINSDNE